LAKPRLDALQFRLNILRHLGADSQRWVEVLVWALAITALFLMQHDVRVLFLWALATLEHVHVLLVHLSQCV